MIKTEDAVKLCTYIHLCEKHKNRRLLRVKRSNQLFGPLIRNENLAVLPPCSEFGCFDSAYYVLNVILDAAEVDPAYDQT